MTTQWTRELLQRVDRLLDQGADYDVLAERFGFRNGPAFRNSYASARRRAQRDVAHLDRNKPPRVAAR